MKKFKMLYEQIKQQCDEDKIHNDVVKSISKPIDYKGCTIKVKFYNDSEDELVYVIYGVNQFKQFNNIDAEYDQEYYSIDDGGIFDSIDDAIYSAKCLIDDWEDESKNFENKL